MAKDISQPDPTIVLDLLAAYRRSKVMFAGVELGIFDALEFNGKNSEELSRHLGCDVHAMTRLLNALVGIGLLRKQGDCFINSEAARAFLTHASPTRFTGYIKYSNDVAWKLWGNLEGAIRQGTHRWEETFGWDGPIFANFFKTEAALKEFLMGMNGFGVLSSPYVVNAFDLSRFRTLADLGTASGHLVIAACKRYEHLRGIAFDLPEAIPLAKELIDASLYADRIEVVSGDFFKDPLPKADLYALGRILHDWSIDKIEVLLKKIFDALPSGGGLLIAEKILYEDGTGPSWGQMQDLNMLVCTEGQERTLNQYEELLVAAGFGEVIGCRTSAPIDAILALKR